MSPLGDPSVQFQQVPLSASLKDICWFKLLRTRTTHWHVCPSRRGWYGHDVRRTLCTSLKFDEKCLGKATERTSADSAIIYRSMAASAKLTSWVFTACGNGSRISGAISCLLSRSMRRRKCPHHLSKELSSPDIRIKVHPKYFVWLWHYSLTLAPFSSLN